MPFFHNCHHYNLSHQQFPRDECQDHRNHKPSRLILWNLFLSVIFSEWQGLLFVSTRRSVILGSSPGVKLGCLKFIWLVVNPGSIEPNWRVVDLGRVDFGSYEVDLGRVELKWQGLDVVSVELNCSFVDLGGIKNVCRGVELVWREKEFCWLQYSEINSWFFGQSRVLSYGQSFKIQS